MSVASLTDLTGGRRWSAASFAPALAGTDLVSLHKAADEAGGMSKEYMHKLADMVELFMGTPESTIPAVQHRNTLFSFIPLEEDEKIRIWEAVPWPHELDMMSAVFHKELPSKEKDALRKAAYHLIWYGRELNKDREPVTVDMRKRLLGKGVLVNNVRHSPTIRSIICDAAVDYLDGGTGAAVVTIYGGSRPAAITDASSATVLADVTCNATAFGAASNGVATANDFTPDTNANGSGDATHYRIRRGAAGDTAAAMEGTAGDTSGEEIDFDNKTIVAAGTVDITAMTYTVPVGT